MALNIRCNSWDYLFFNLTRDIYIMKNSVENIQKGDFNKIHSES